MDNDYGFTLDALALKPSGFCKDGVYYGVIYPFAQNGLYGVLDCMFAAKGKNIFLPIKLLFAILVAVLVLLTVGSCTPSVRQKWPQNPGFSVHFIYVDPQAKSVCLSGSFNQWSSQSHCMHREGNTWSVVVMLPTGRYAYGFLIDGNNWQADPGATLSEESGFGTINSILIVE